MQLKSLVFHSAPLLTLFCARSQEIKRFLFPCRTSPLSTWRELSAQQNAPGLLAMFLHRLHFMNCKNSCSDHVFPPRVFSPTFSSMPEKDASDRMGAACTVRAE